MEYAIIAFLLFQNDTNIQICFWTAVVSKVSTVKRGKGKKLSEPVTGAMDMQSVRKLELMFSVSIIHYHYRKTLNLDTFEGLISFSFQTHGLCWRMACNLHHIKFNVPPASAAEEIQNIKNSPAWLSLERVGEPHGKWKVTFKVELAAGAERNTNYCGQKLKEEHNILAPFCFAK